MSRTGFFALIASLAVMVPNIVDRATATQPGRYYTAAANNPDAWERDGKRIELAISVIEDPTASFDEFPQLKSGMLLVGDSSTTLGAVRIMNKHQITKCISAPKIICNVGERATVTTNPSEAQKAKGDASVVDIVATPRLIQNGPRGLGIQVEMHAEAKRNGVAQNAAVAFLVNEDQTAVVKVGRRSTDGNNEVAPTFVVVTPKLLK